MTTLTGTALRYAMMDLAASMKDVIALGRGDPDLDTPPHIVAAAKAAMERGDTERIPPVEGLLELRQAIARKLWRENNIQVDPVTEVLVTTGGQEALFLLVQALLDPGDEILVPDPRYTSYDQAIQKAGGVMVSVPTREEDDFDMRAEEVASRITPRTKAILIVSPGNPTPGIVTARNIRGIAALAQQHNLIVISDEIYERFIYDGAEYLSIASLPGMKERTITLNGVSKTYAMTGWRVGYLAAPAELIAVVRGLKATVSRGTAMVSQIAAVTALDGPQDCVEAMRQTYDERRHLMMDALRRMGFAFGYPWGAFYLFANVRPLGTPALELCYHFLRDGKVLIFPGNSFGENWGNHLRISLLQPKDKLVEAIRRMESVVERLKAGELAPPALL